MSAQRYMLTDICVDPAYSVRFMLAYTCAKACATAGPMMLAKIVPS